MAQQYLYTNFASLPSAQIDLTAEESQYYLIAYDAKQYGEVRLDLSQTLNPICNSLSAACVNISSICTALSSLDLKTKSTLPIYDSNNNIVFDYSYDVLTNIGKVSLPKNINFTAEHLNSSFIDAYNIQTLYLECVSSQINTLTTSSIAGQIITTSSIAGQILTNEYDGDNITSNITNGIDFIDSIRSGDSNNIVMHGFWIQYIDLSELIAKIPNKDALLNLTYDSYMNTSGYYDALKVKIYVSQNRRTVAQLRDLYLNGTQAEKVINELPSTFTKTYSNGNKISTRQNLNYSYQATVDTHIGNCITIKNIEWGILQRWMQGIYNGAGLASQNTPYVQNTDTQYYIYSCDNPDVGPCIIRYQGYAFGGSNNVGDSYSFSQGNSSKTPGKYASAFGIESNAASYAQFVVGSYNIPDCEAKYQFIVGNGGTGTLDSNNIPQYSNAFAVDRRGGIIAGLNNKYQPSVYHVFGACPNTYRQPVNGGVKGAEAILITGSNNEIKTLSADNAVVMGEGNIAQIKNQTVIGQYNNPSNSSLFVVGNGTTSTKHNAFEITSKGEIKLPIYSEKGNVLAGKYCTIRAVSASNGAVTLQLM